MRSAELVALWLLVLRLDEQHDRHLLKALFNESRQYHELRWVRLTSCADLNLDASSSLMSQWPPAPPAYTLESQESHQGYHYNPPGFRAPPPPPPLPTRLATIDIPGRNPEPQNPSRVHNPLYDAEAAPQQEIDYAPSTPSRRPLPAVPGSVSNMPVVTPPAVEPSRRYGSASDYISAPVGEPGQQGYDAPPAFSPIQIVASPERLNANLPRTPGSVSSSTRRRRQHRQSELSFNSSIRSGGSSIRSTQTPASFNSNEPPPWVIPYQPDNANQSQTNTTAAPNNPDFSLPHLNPDPGHAVMCKAFHLYLNKGSRDVPPAYGRGEPVEGYVELKEIDHVSEIEVTVRITYPSC